jgi:hypothetical protein
VQVLSKGLTGTLISSQLAGQDTKSSHDVAPIDVAPIPSDVEKFGLSEGLQEGCDEYNQDHSWKAKQQQQMSFKEMDASTYRTQNSLDLCQYDSHLSGRDGALYRAETRAKEGHLQAQQPDISQDPALERPQPTKQHDQHLYWSLLLTFKKEVIMSWILDVLACEGTL